MNRPETSTINALIGCGMPGARSQPDKHGDREIVKESHLELRPARAEMGVAKALFGTTGGGRITAAIAPTGKRG